MIKLTLFTDKIDTFHKIFKMNYFKNFDHELISRVYFFEKKYKNGYICGVYNHPDPILHQNNSKTSKEYIKFVKNCIKYLLHRHV